MGEGMIQRIRDYLRELRIERIKRQAIAAGNSFRAFELWAEFYYQIGQRSPQQIERMEICKKLGRKASPNGD